MRPSSIDQRLDDARLLLASGSAAEAAERLQALAIECPQESKVWSAQADCQRALGNPEAETDACERALAIDPRLWWLRIRLAEILSRGGKLSEAADHYELVSDARPHHLKPALRLATVCERLGDPRRQASAWTRIVALQPHNIDARQRLVALRKKLKRSSSAETQLIPSGGKVRDFRGLAHVCEEAGDFEAALSAWRRVLELNPDDLGAPERLALAEIIDRDVASPSGKSPHVIVLGNCQVYSISACLRALSPGVKIAGLSWVEFRSTAQIERLLTILDEVDAVLIQPHAIQRLRSLSADVLTSRGVRCVQFPRIHFPGFHPDASRLSGGSPKGLIGPWHSALMMAGHRMGLPEARTEGLFNAYIYGMLGYFDEYSKAGAFQTAASAALDWDLSSELKSWTRPFVHVPNHPSVEVMMDLARGAATRLGIEIDPQATAPPDPLLRAGSWPLYPEIAKRLGLVGEMRFAPTNDPGRGLDLGEAIARSYAIYAKAPGAVGSGPRIAEIIELLKAEGV